MAEQGDIKEPPGVKINFNPDRLKKFLRAKDKEDNGLYTEVARHSRDYMDAFRLNSDDIGILEKKQERSYKTRPRAKDHFKGSVIKLEIEGKKFGIFAKNFPYWLAYGGDGGYLLMAVSNDYSLNKTEGRGGSLIISVGEEWHDKILQVVKLSSKQDTLSGELFGFLKK